MGKDVFVVDVEGEVEGFAIEPLIACDSGLVFVLGASVVAGIQCPLAR